MTKACKNTRITAINWCKWSAGKVDIGAKSIVGVDVIIYPHQPGSVGDGGIGHLSPIIPFFCIKLGAATQQINRSAKTKIVVIWMRCLISFGLPINQTQHSAACNRHIGVEVNIVPSVEGQQISACPCHWCIDIDIPIATAGCSGVGRRDDDVSCTQRGLQGSDINRRGCGR